MKNILITFSSDTFKRKFHISLHEWDEEKQENVLIFENIGDKASSVFSSATKILNEPGSELFVARRNRKLVKVLQPNKTTVEYGIKSFGSVPKKKLPNAFATCLENCWELYSNKTMEEGK